jgi:hypothetical protein
MTVSTGDIRKAYELFNDNDIDALVGQFAPDGVYYQADSWQTAKGADQIRAVMQGWKSSFTDAQIKGVEIQERPDFVDQVPKSVQCFLVNFTGVGVYTKTLPGLETSAPAHSQPVQLPISETVWVDSEGKFVRVTNKITMSALKFK